MLVPDPLNEMVNLLPGFSPIKEPAVVFKSMYASLVLVIIFTGLFISIANGSSAELKNFPWKSKVAPSGTKSLKRPEFDLLK